MELLLKKLLPLLPEHVRQRLESMLLSGIGKRLSGGAFWSIAGSAVQYLCILVALMVCAKILGKENFGKLNLVQNTINIFVVLGAMGMGNTAAKYISEYRETQKERAAGIYVISGWSGGIMGALLAFVVILVAPFIAEKVSAPDLTDCIRWGGLWLFFSTLSGIQTGVLSGFENFRMVAVNSIITGIVEGVMIIIGARLWGITGAILGYGVGFLVWTLANALAISTNLRRENIVPRWTRVSRDDFKIIHQFSLPAMLSTLMVMPVFLGIKMMLAKFDGFGEVGVYGAADQWKTMILFIPSAMSRIALPILSNIRSKGEIGTYTRVLLINVMMNAGVTVFLSAIVIGLSKNIMLLYGRDFLEPMPLILLALSTIFTSIASVVGLAIASQSKMWIGFGFNLLWGVVALGLCYLFLQRGLGARGAAAAILLSYLIHTVLQSFYLAWLIRKDKCKKAV